MGFNTVAVLYNDQTHLIRDDGPIGARIARAIQAWTSRHDHGKHDINFGAGLVVSQAHADYSQVVVVGRNTGSPISEATDLDWSALAQCEDVLRRHGYTVKPPAKKRKTA